MLIEVERSVKKCSERPHGSQMKSQNGKSGPSTLKRPSARLSVHKCQNSGSCTLTARLVHA